MGCAPHKETSAFTLSSISHGRYILIDNSTLSYSTYYTEGLNLIDVHAWYVEQCADFICMRQDLGLVHKPTKFTSPNWTTTFSTKSSSTNRYNRKFQAKKSSKNKFSNYSRHRNRSLNYFYSVALWHKTSRTSSRSPFP